MSGQTDNTKLSKSAIEELLTNTSCDVEVFDVIDSTNLEAKRRTLANFDKPLLLVAEEQTAGKGRMGRQFYSPKTTGLYMSYLYQPTASFSDSVTVTAAAAVAVSRAINKLTDLEPQIKWVNDIYIDGKKVCGILTEAVTGQKNAIIVGIGVNITTEQFPEDIVSIADSLKRKLDRNRLAAEIVKELQTLIKELPDRTFIEEYRERSCVLNQEVVFIKNGEEYFGKAIDIDRDGGLVVETEAGKITLNTGEITLRVRK